MGGGVSLVAIWYNHQKRFYNVTINIFYHNYPILVLHFVGDFKEMPTFDYGLKLHLFVVCPPLGVSAPLRPYLVANQIKSTKFSIAKMVISADL